MPNQLRPVPTAPVLALITAFEGFEPTRYQDASGNWAIGYGHDLSGMDDPLWDVTLDEDQARALAIEDVTKTAVGVCNTLSPMVLNALTAGQYAAILDFAYNLGVGAFAASTLCHFIQIGNMAAVPGQFALWTHERINGIETIEQGLVRRRAAEVDVWNSPAPA